MWVYLILTVQLILGMEVLIMSHKNKKSLVRQVQEAYDSMLAIGQSKHQDKINGVIGDKIYSWSTYNNYMKHANYFAKYCKEEHGCRTLEQCKTYINEWLMKRMQEGLSPFTIKLEASALAKLYRCSTIDFIKTPARKREDINRSRGEKVRDIHFSESNHRELVDFCRSTGLRRSELKVLTGDKLIHKDGKYYIVVNRGSKGGRYRELVVIGDIANVKQLMNKAGQERIFTKIPGGADIHGYRAEYATALYNKLARPIEEIPYDAIHPGIGILYQSDVYNCRSDRKGVKLDKKAMQLNSSQRRVAKGSLFVYYLTIFIRNLHVFHCLQ